MTLFPPIDPTTLSPGDRAKYDFQHEGLGLDGNPYNKETQRESYDAYMMSMAKLQYTDFQQDLAEAKLAKEQDRDTKC